MNLEKAKQRLSEIKSMMEKSDFYKSHSLEEKSEIYKERTECEFIINKQNINFRLSGQNKYYHANQCAKFVRSLEKNGFGKYAKHGRYKDEISKMGISFHKHSINIGSSSHGEALERFNNSKELLSFVIGYNRAMEAV